MHKNYSVFKNSWILLLLLISSLSFAQNKIWDGGARTINWGDANNWAPNGVPTAAETVTIGNGYNVTVNVAAVCSSLMIGGGNTANTVTISGTNSLTVSGAVVINAGTGNADNKILAVGTGTLNAASVTMAETNNDNRYSRLSLSTGTVNVSGNITMGGTAARNQVTFTGAGTLNVGGDMSGGGLTASTGTVNYNGNGAQSVGGYNYYNLTTSGSGVKTMAGAITVNKDLFVSNGITLMDNEKQITGTSTGKLTVESNAILWLGREVQNGTTSTLFPTNFTKTNIDLKPGSKVLYNSWVPQTISYVPDYYNLECQYPGVKSTSGAGTLTVKGDLSTASVLNLAGTGTPTVNIAGDFNLLAVNAIVTLTKGTTTIGGDFNNTLTSLGSIVPNGGTVVFNGTSSQLIKGTGDVASSFYNLQINNTAGVTVAISGANDDVTVNNMLIMTNGIFTTSSTNLLNVTNSVTAAIAGGSTTSFVNGPIKWSTTQNGTYSFPVGKGSTYLPFILNTKATTGTTAQVEAFTTNSGGSPIFADPTTATTLGSLSDTEYWSLLTTGTFDNSSVSLTRPSDIAPFDAIGGSSTAAAGTYSSLGGTPSGTNVLVNSTAIGANLFFTFGQKNGIRTGNVTGSPFCAGSTVTVPYTTTGTFVSGNVFSAQLSNSAGSFASPTQLATVSQSAGNIIATIPAGTVSGTGYRIRVVSTNPAVLGSNNGANLTINANLPVSVSIAASPGTTICAGTSVTFTATPTNGGTTPTYQWKLNGTDITGATSSTFATSTLANNDKVTVAMTSNASPCLTGSPAPSNELIMMVNPNLPASVSIVASPGTTICAGTSVTFTATPTNGGTTPTYQWKLNGTNITGATSATYTTTTLANNNKVTVVMTSNASPCLTNSPAISNEITMTVNPNLPASVTIATLLSAQICEGTSIKFTATPKNGGTNPTYQWKVNGTAIPGETASTFTTTTLVNGDKVTVEMTSNASPCLTGSPATSNEFTMIINSLPATVSVTGNGQICSGLDAIFTITGTPGSIVTYNINGGSNTTIVLPETGSAGVEVSAATADQVLNIVSVSNGTCVNYTTSATTVIVGAVSIYKDGDWSLGLPSDNGLSASIESNYETGQGNIKACNCTVKAGATLTISTNTYMEVLNNIANKGILVVESEGNLKQINDNAVNTGNIYVRRKHNLTSGRKEYNFLSSPVQYQNMKLIFGNNTSYIPFVTVLNESTNAFVNAVAADWDKPARGFSVKEPTVSYVGIQSDFGDFISPNEALYKGSPNNGNIAIGVTRSASNRGWNVIGNPYPSNLDVQLLYQDNSDKIGPEFRFWDNKVNATYVQFGGAYNGYSYAVYNAVTGVNGFGSIAPGKDGGENTDGGSAVGNKKSFKVVKVSQAFMVRATDTPGLINYKNAYRMTSQTNTTFYGKGNGSEESSFRIQLVTPDQLVLTQGVVYFQGGNNAFGIEDSKHPAPSSSDAFYSFVDDNKVIINGRSVFDRNDVIKLGTQNYIGGQYKIRAIDQEGVFANGQNIYIKDNVLNVIANLSENGYEFTSTSGVFTNRFEIVYEPGAVLATGSTVKSNLEVYRDAQDFVVQSSAKKITSFDLYDMSGRIIMSQKTNTKEIRFDAKILVDGTYILKVKLEDGETSSRKIRK